MGEQLKSWASLSKESIGIGLLLLLSSTTPAEDFLLAEVSLSLGEEGGVDSEWGEEGVDTEMEERVLLPPRVLLSLSISARFNLKPSEGIPVNVLLSPPATTPAPAPAPEKDARAGDEVVEWALMEVLELELELEVKKREVWLRETPRPLLPAAGWFRGLLGSMESRDCCLSKILGIDSLPFFFATEDEDDFSEEERVFLLVTAQWRMSGQRGQKKRKRKRLLEERWRDGEVERDERAIRVIVDRGEILLGLLGGLGG